ncbi:LytR/AlgR family response regulator transcription factor [Parapedobacter sp. 10938]|uniref:LytR/AlgR family response regulator transcription factor n=1 Tax=Parapedobacter flavus TaxID=3110225 RepID=UPI002DBEF176|nr:LytTR family DNA-binding domain-containing protein [Parapedobacter sp. 10938]MEC3880709.1 LytTR family DNA-binding domain-containing protein [Parapedobacter sp. 10938]
MMITAIAVDDEPIALDVVRNHAAKVPFLDLQATFTNAFEAMGHLRQHPVDLLFLDIKMPDISGIEFFRSLSKKPLVVFTTAYSEHAVAGFELDAVDYLLKPFSLPRFLKACNKAQEWLELRGKETKPAYIFVKTGYDQVKVDFDTIDYLEATGNYVNFVLGDSQLLSRMTITECEALLPADRFVRIHRSFIAAIDNVRKIERHQLTINGSILPIGASYVAAVKERVQK